MNGSATRSIQARGVTCRDTYSRRPYSLRFGKKEGRRCLWWLKSESICSARSAAPALECSSHANHRLLRPSDFTHMNISDSAATLGHLAQLRPPPEAINDNAEDAHAIVRLQQWKEQSYVGLARLRESLRSTKDLTVEDHVRIVSTAAGFDGDEHWISDSSRGVAQGTAIVLLGAITAPF